MHHIDWVALVGPLIGGVGGFSGLWAFFRLLPKVLDRGRLLAENATLRDQVTDQSEALSTLRTLAESSKTAIEQLKIELALAVSYIGTLVVYLKQGGKAEGMPSTPPELQRLINEHVAAIQDKT